ncbi:MAG: hypothetical protein HKO93_00920 [Flavobacteriales bacterium]|nr:hypothetical protein [Flavobacteriales bacterium]
MNSKRSVQIRAGIKQIENDIYISIENVLDKDDISEILIPLENWGTVADYIDAAIEEHYTKPKDVTVN